MMWSCVGLLVDLSAGLLNKSLIKYRAVFTNNYAPRTVTLTLDNCLAKAVGVNERVNIRIVWVVCYVELFLYRPAIISRRSDLSDYLPSFFVCHCDGSCRPGCSSSDLAMLADTHTLRDVSLYSSRTLCMCLSACKVQREPTEQFQTQTEIACFGHSGEHCPACCEIFVILVPCHVLRLTFLLAYRER